MDLVSILNIFNCQSFRCLLLPAPLDYHCLPLVLSLGRSDGDGGAGGTEGLKVVRFLCSFLPFEAPPAAAASAISQPCSTGRPGSSAAPPLLP